MQVPEKHPLLTDKELLRRISGGDESAFRSLVNEHADFLLTYLIRLTSDREMAEEIVQDVFLKVWEARSYLVHVENFKSYLFILSRNHALNAIDKVLTSRKRHDEWARQDFSEEDSLAYEHMMDLVDQAIAKLPPQQHKVWVMSRREGKTYVEIAAELGISRETVKFYLKLANNSITGFLKNHPDLVCLALSVMIF